MHRLQYCQHKTYWDDWNKRGLLCTRQKRSLYQCFEHQLVYFVTNFFVLEETNYTMKLVGHCIVIPLKINKERDKLVSQRMKIKKIYCNTKLRKVNRLLINNISMASSTCKLEVKKTNERKITRA